MTLAFIFYWFSWLIWGFTTFFMKKNQLRLLLSSLILIIILCSNIYLSIDENQILLSFIIFLVISGLLHTNFLQSFYHLFVSFMVMISYTAILFWKQTTSLLLFIPEFLINPLLCLFLVILMVKGVYSRFLTTIFGIATGEVLHGIILSSYHLPIIIGDIDFFIKIYVIISCIIFLKIIRNGKAKLFALINHGYTLKDSR